MSAKPFEGLLGNTCELRILEFLLPQTGIGYSIRELSAEINVKECTISRAVNRLLEWKILEPSLSKGSVRINPNSPIVNSIIQFNNAVIENMLDEETLRRIHEGSKHT